MHNDYDMAVLTAAIEIKDEIGELIPNLERAYGLAAQAAEGMGEPEASWFMGDVMNALNELDMQDEV